MLTTAQAVQSTIFGYFPIHGKGNWSKECECGYCTGIRAEAKAEVDKYRQYVVRNAPKPVNNPINTKREDIPEVNGMVDYKAIFSDETNKLIALYGNVEQEIKAEDDAKAMGIIEQIDSNMRALEAALEELRIRKQARLKFRDDTSKKLSREKKEKLAQADMDLRQKKQQEKLDKAANMKQLQAAQFRKAMSDIGMPEDKINEMLKKKGLL